MKNAKMNAVLASVRGYAEFHDDESPADAMPANKAQFRSGRAAIQTDRIRLSELHGDPPKEQRPVQLTGAERHRLSTLRAKRGRQRG